MSRLPSKPPQNNFFFKPPANFGMVIEADRLFRQGIALLNQGSLQQAREILEKVVKINPKYFDAFHLLGILAAQLKDFESVRLYAKTENFRAAVVSAQSFLDNFPLSKFKNFPVSQ